MNANTNTTWRRALLLRLMPKRKLLEDVRGFGRECERSLAMIGTLSDLDAMMSVLAADPDCSNLVSRLKALRDDLFSSLMAGDCSDERHVDGLSESGRSLMSEGRRAMKSTASSYGCIGHPGSLWLAALQSATETVNVAEELKTETRQLLEGKRQLDPTVTATHIVGCLFRAKADLFFCISVQAHVPEMHSRIMEYRGEILRRRGTSKRCSDYLNALHFGKYFHSVDSYLRMDYRNIGRQKVVGSLTDAIACLLKAANLLEA